MNKIWLIIKREYITRVRKKSFVVITLLVPILMFVLIGGSVYLSLKSTQSQIIIVQDDSQVFKGKIETKDKSYSILYDNLNEGEDKVSFLKKKNADIYVHILPFVNNAPDSIMMYKEGGVSLVVKEFISSQLSSIYQKKQLTDAGIDKAQIDRIEQDNIEVKSYDLKDNKETNSEIASVIGYAMGFIIYLVIFIYGAGVMRGVMEEKTNRIAEVIVSSVKPFQLMMGKIIGIALVGLTQFLMWIGLMFILQFLLPLFIPGLGDMLHGGGMNIAETQGQMQELSKPENMGLIKAVMDQNWVLLLMSFLFYFLGGYFLYASMFAAVGSLVNEDPQEAQQMTIPITMPIILGFIIMATSVKDPNSNLSVFGSLFPLTSPIVMLARIPYGVPAWQLILSMALLIAGFILMTWLSAKIYRTGILMYGKKASWKEVFKWIRHS